MNLYRRVTLDLVVLTRLYLSKNLIEQSKIMVLCSHSHAKDRDHCDKAIFFHRGQVKFIGGAKETVRRYEQFVLQQISREENNIADRRKKRRMEKRYQKRRKNTLNK